MDQLFVYGTSWFWILTVVFAIWAIVCVESKGSQGASFVILLYLAILYYYGEINPFPWIAQNPGQTVGIFCVYILSGTVWSVAKWRFFVRSKARLCEELRVVLSRQNGWSSPSFSGLSEEQRAQVFKAAGLKVVPPSVLDEKSRILAWMVWWPLSAAWTLVNDPIRRMFQNIYFRLAKYLQSVSDDAFKEL